MDEFKTFDFHRIFFGDLPYLFLLEIVFRTAIMYFYTIVLLRFLGKRSMGQLSTLELAIIICFGSAVGDPMMGKDIPIIHGMVVITSVALLQTGAEWVINRNKRLEAFMEGRPDCLVENGLIVNTSLDRNNLSHEDLFRFLRTKDIEHLGQVKNAFFETSGLVSVWCFSKPEVRPGLGILPEEQIAEDSIIPSGTAIKDAGHFSCKNCGYTDHVSLLTKLGECKNCGEKEWSRSVEPD
ncbi:DUF421 domain-containing protein [Pedobacter endophyticus]|uniref:DUF421 domain-containing protein n=1 Tax=Pedobacter endophyticus TaxID=2789740 RepID=A0A7S9PZE9_9SPHI|nr:YetF domain-containing protein [Pedobacter endophyticus]QPH39577.1 DUF421 domain-containing protein [Pedobacter endophyticus]